MIELAIDERLEHDIANPDRLAALLEAALDGETSATAQPDPEQAANRALDTTVADASPPGILFNQILAATNASRVRSDSRAK